MFYLGEYEEDTAKEIKSYLDKAGLKVEMKPCLVIEEDTSYYLKDKMSAIKELIEDTSQFEPDLSAMKSALPLATADNFEDLYLKELFPAMIEKRDKIIALSTNPEGISEEEKEALKFSQEEWTESSLKTDKAMSFARMVLENNDVKIGEPVEDKLDDPVLLLRVSPESFETKPKQLKCDIDFYLDKSVTLFVDEFTTPLAGELGDEFWDEYPSEAQSLKVLGLLIEKLATSPSSRKMDFAQFADECALNLDDEDSNLYVDGVDVAEELAHVLEKGGVIKWKGDRIKWKGKD
jgi:hypothetical protein